MIEAKPIQASKATANVIKAEFIKAGSGTTPPPSGNNLVFQGDNIVYQGDNVVYS
jgi:hypothetical protein